MNNHKVNPMKKLLRNVVLLSSVALLALGSGVPVQAASPAPSPSPSPSPSASPKVAPSPSPKPRTAASPTPLPANAPKPGLKPSLAPRIVAKKGSAAPTVTAPSASLAATSCGASCHLYATDGTLAIPGLLEPLDVWGFTTDNTVAHNASVPGPTLIFNENDSITVNLTNNLPSPFGISLPAAPTCPDDPRCISLELPAVSMAPDTIGVAWGSSKVYSIGHLAPGTYLYEAGPTPHAQRQIRMGLSGLLIVRPKAFATAAVAGAYDGPTPGTVDGLFTAESVAELNEFDPEFNRSPYVADPVDYSPSVYTFNGHAFNPDPALAGVGKIDVGNSDTLLLHYANLGSHDRGMTILDHRQRVLAEDSHLLTNPGDVATKWLTSGQVSDAFVTIDPQEQLGTRIPIFESGYHLSNGAGLGLGGAMNYLDVVSGVAGVASGPLTSVSIATFTNGFPANHTGTQPLTFTATINATAPASLSDGEWFLDGVGAQGTGYKFTDTTHATCKPVPVSGVTAVVTCVMTAKQLNDLLATSAAADGDHIIWAHGMDAGGWGVVSGDVFSFNATGPVIGSVTSHAAVSCTPDPSVPPCTATNGYSASTVTGTSVNVPVHTNVANGASNTHLVNGQRVTCTAADVAATPSVGCAALGDDVPSTDLVLLGTAAASLADWVVLGGEYCLDPAGNDPKVCPLAGSAINAMKLVTTPGPTTGLAKTFTYAGPAVPDACVPTASPAGVNAPQLGAAPGGGSVVSFCAVVPTATLTALTEKGPGPNGAHVLYFHAYEAPNSADLANNAKPGRWGAYDASTAATFMIDRTGPNAGTPVIDHNPNNGSIFSAGNLNFLDSLQVATTFDDTKAGYGSSTITTGEVFLSKPDVIGSPVPAAEFGTGAEMVPSGGKWDSPTKLAYAYIPLAELTAYQQGYVKFWVHAKDIAGNWGDWSTVLLTLDRTAPSITSSIPANLATTTLTCVGAPGGCAISFSATDPPVSATIPGSNIVQAEWFTAFPDPGVGLGNPITNLSVANPTVTGSFQPVAASGTQIFFRVKDAAGNWSPTSMVVAK